MRIVNQQPTDDAPGEEIVLNLIKQLEDDWIVIHQARFPKRRKWDSNRIVDFIFVVPRKGILLLEIKSSKVVNFVDGTFQVGSQRDDPLKQVDDEFGAMYRWHQATFADTLGPRLTMTGTLGFTAATPAGSDAIRFMKSPSTHHHYQVFYEESFRDPETFRSAVVAALSDAAKDWNSGALLFGPKEAERWTEQLMPSVPMRASHQASLNKFISEREQFTEQQQAKYYGLLKIVPKVFISGAWGTGKTFLAKHIALRSALEGRRVCIVVKRAELRRQISDAFRDVNSAPGRVDVVSVDQLLKESGRQKYDEMVLDQAEDYLSVRVLEALGDSLEGGWGPTSRVKIFADFQHQGYQLDAQVAAMRAWLEKAGFAGVREEPLSHNLRNGKLIAQNVEKVGGVKAYSDYLSEDGVVEVRRIDPGPLMEIYHEEMLNHVILRTWNVSQALLLTLKKLKDEGYHPGDIVVLTALPREAMIDGEPSAVQSSPAFVALGWDYKAINEGEIRNGHDGSREAPYQPDDFRVKHDRLGLTEEWIPRDRKEHGSMKDQNSCVTWCTVEEFAGCESAVVVLTDSDLAAERVRRKRLTRGISRASEKVVVLLIDAAPRDRGH